MFMYQFFLQMHLSLKFFSYFTHYQEGKHPLGGRSLVFENNHLFIDEWAIYFKRIEKSCTTDHLNERADTICSSTTHTKSRRRQETLKQTWFRPKKVSLKTKWEITKKKKIQIFLLITELVSYKMRFQFALYFPFDLMIFSMTVLKKTIAICKFSLAYRFKLFFEMKILFC